MLRRVRRDGCDNSDTTDDSNDSTNNIKVVILYWKGWPPIIGVVEEYDGG